MNLFEAKIDNMDAMQAAQKFPLMFKQEVAKAIARKGFKVDREKSFKGSRTYEKANRANKLYSPYGVSSKPSYSRDRDNPQEIEIVIHNTLGITNKRGIQNNNLVVSLKPDTMGNVDVKVIGDDSDYVGKVAIAGKTVRQLVVDVAKTTKHLFKKFDSGDESVDQESSEEFLKDAEQFVRSVSDKVGTGIGVSSGYGPYNEKEGTLYLSPSLELAPKDVLAEAEEDRRFFNFLSNAFQETYIKSAYRRATGESAGRKDDRYNLANDFYKKRHDVLRWTQLKYGYSALKEVLLKLNEFAKSRGVRIYSVMRSDEYAQPRIIVKFVPDTPQPFYERPSKGERFNIYKFLKEFKESLEGYNEKESSYKFADKIILPVSKQLIKQLFKEA